MATMKRATIRVDETLYPRYAKNSGTITNYVEAKRGGAEFPDVQVDQHGRLIDGVHRLAMYDILGIEDIPAEKVRVKDDADFFKRALAANAHHGQRYTHIDYAHMVMRGRELGLTSDKIAELVFVTPGYLDEVTDGWFAKNRSGGLVPLKSTIRHMKGQTLTEDQEAANKRLSGMKPSFYANQVILLVDNDLIDTSNENVIERLKALEESLRVYLMGLAKRKREGR